MQSVEARPPSRVTRKAERRADATYRNYRIVVGQRGDRFAGVAYAGKIPVFHVEAEALERVECALQNQIDSDLAERKEKARAGWSSEDYVLALYLVSPILTPVQTHIIKRIAETKGDAVNLEQLRWPSIFGDDAVLRALTRLAKMIGHALDGSTARKPSGSGRNLVILVEGDDSQPWTFKPSFAAAAEEFAEAVL